tara:strand:+ start:1471 stop:1911 length:441 start_codon:yes stop_codon:yes gene_type:complete
LKKYYILSFFLVLIDLSSKYYVKNYITEDYFILNNLLGIELTYNTGIAWGMFSGHAEYTLVLSLLVCGWLLTQIQNSPKEPLVSLFLILSGALGNISERLFGLITGNGGRVTDFFVLGPIPNFNIADSLITIGITYLFIDEFRRKK